MAYLPPAGVRHLTSHKRTDMVFGVEVPNIFHYGDRSRVPYDINTNSIQIDIRDLPPTSIKREDWEVPKQTIYRDELCPLNSKCPVADYVCFMADDYNQYDYRAKKMEAFKEKYRVTYDVKIRKDAQTCWQNESMKVFAINRQWEDRYGKKYFYKCCCTKKR